MEVVQEIDKIKLVGILEHIVGEMEDWVIIGDQDGKIIYANENVYKSCACSKEQVLGQDMCMFVGVDLTDDATLNKIQQFVRNGKKFNFVTSRFIKNNKRIYLTNTLSTTWDNESLEYCVCISKDITNTQKLRQEIYSAKYFDPLTHFPNRLIFHQSIEKEIRKSKKEHTQFAIIILDIKKISEINHNYSFNVGDQIIREVGKRLHARITTKQEIFAISGNVFGIIYRQIQNEEEVVSFLKGINDLIDEPVKIHNSSIYVEIKAGISLFPKNATIKNDLINMAQVAIIKAKKETKQTSYIFYTEDIQEEVENTLQIEEDLQNAVKNDEFIVYYQPFIALETNQIVGMEALVRRRKENGEIVFPGSFINILEQSSLIEQVGMRVLEKVCMQLRKWLDAGYSVVPVAVNLSARQFKNPDLARNIKKVLFKYSIPSSLVILEITESTVMEDIGIAQLIIDELKGDGFAISMDDFGTGYASIGYLKKFMFDHLKIDISFIREIVQNKEDRSIVEAIITIAKSLNLTTIAEGIENKNQRDVMTDLGCEMGQGFFWDKPITSEDIEVKYLKRYS